MVKPPPHFSSYPIPESTVTTIPQGGVTPGPSGRRSQVLAVSALSSVENKIKKCGCKIKVLKVMTAKNFNKFFFLLCMIWRFSKFVQKKKKQLYRQKVYQGAT